MESVDSTFNYYFKKLEKALEDKVLRTAINRSVMSFRKTIKETLSRYPHTLLLRHRARKIKEYSIRHMYELIKEARDALEDSGSQTFLAKTAVEAQEITGDIVGRNKLILKSKSLTTEEIKLNRYLESLGNRVIETDLGEFIIQLLGSKPMHPISPAIHVTKEIIAKLFREKLGFEVMPNPKELTMVARKYLRNLYMKADVGISGANVIAADIGAIFIIENEGNARLVTSAPPKHIVIVGIDKIVPTIHEALVVSEVTWRYAMYKAPSYISIITGPSKTGDIEYTIVRGAHGPKDLYVVFLDNGRSKMLKHEVYREALLCLRCGSCFLECPVFQLVAGNYGYIYFGGIGAVWTAFTEGFEIASPIAYTCLLCGRCKIQCPMEIDIPKLIETLRYELYKKGFIPKYVKNFINKVIEKGSPYVGMG